VGEELKTPDAIIRVTKADERRIIEVEIEKTVEESGMENETPP
jgi:hypothetical protein